MSDGEGFMPNEFEFDQFQFEQNYIQDNDLNVKNQECNFFEEEVHYIDFEQNFSFLNNDEQKDKISSTFQLNEEQMENKQRENSFLLKKTTFDEKINISRSRSRESEKEQNSKQKRWTHEEEELLNFWHKQYCGNWQQIAAKIEGRTISQCKQFWQRKHKIETKKTQWTEQEDQIIKDNINYAENNWAEIAKLLKNKTGKQIRERYINQLREDAQEGKKLTWTAEEDQKILSLYQNLGAKWSLISKQFYNRSELQIKNRAKKLINQIPVTQTSFQESKPSIIISDDEIIVDNRFAINDDDRIATGCRTSQIKNIFTFDFASQTINSIQEQKQP